MPMPSFHQQLIARLLVGMQTIFTGISMLFKGSNYPLVDFAAQYGGRPLWAAVFCGFGALTLHRVTWRMGMVVVASLWSAVAVLYIAEAKITPIFMMAVTNTMAAIMLALRDE
jgi:hypothetical protein